MNKLLEKQEKRDLIDNINLDNLSSDIDNYISVLTKIKEKYAENYSKIVIDPYIEHGDDESSCYLEIYGTRMETDGEYDKRIKDYTKKELKNILIDKSLNSKKDDIKYSKLPTKAPMFKRRSAVLTDF